MRSCSTPTQRSVVTGSISHALLCLPRRRARSALLPAAPHGWPKPSEVLLREASPSILVALPHLERDKALQVIAMEIGVGQLLRTGALERDLHVCGPGNVSGPIVLLLGCSTGLADIPFHSFVVRFGEEGAAIVLCTLAVVLGRHIDADHNRSVITFVAAPVGKGMALALSLVAYGDADWECSASARS